MDLNAMRGFYTGQSCFLICDGPSFKGVDKSKLDVPGIVTMGVNNAPSSFRTNMWCFVDPHKNFIESLKVDGKIMKFCPPIYARSMSSPIIPFSTNTIFDENKFLSEPSVNYGDTKENGGGRSVMLAAMKVLYVLGFKNVFLLGVDFSMEKGEDNYHFEQDTSDHSIMANNNTYKKLTNRFKKLKPIMDANDFNVYNCNEKSELKVFPFVSLDDAIKTSTAYMPDTFRENTKGMYKHHRREDVSRRRKARRDNRGSRGIIVRANNQFAINGLSRSGTHAIADWISSQLDGNVQYRNDLHTNGTYKLDKVPERFYTLPSINYIDGSENKEIDHLVYSYENMGKPMDFHKNIRCISGKKIQLLRDPYNLLASLATHVEGARRFWFWKHCTDEGKMSVDKLYNFANMWKIHAKTFLDNNGVIGISYNKWKESTEYRDLLFDQLGLTNRSDECMNLVPKNGGGSSFDKHRMDGNGTEMDNNGRWKKYEDTEWFNTFFECNPDVVELSKTIFGDVIGV
jgi:hypothetical protein